MEAINSFVVPPFDKDEETEVKVRMRKASLTRF